MPRRLLDQPVLGCHVADGRELQPIRTGTLFVTLFFQEGYVFTVVGG